MTPFQFCTRIAVVFVLVVSSNLQQSVNGDGGIGVNYGIYGDNYPTPEVVLAAYRRYNITNIRISSPDPTILQGLEDDGKKGVQKCLRVYLGVPNSDLVNFASDFGGNALKWVQTNIVQHPNVCVDCVIVGNEAIPGHYTKFVAPALHNMRFALDFAGHRNIDISTAIGAQVFASGPAIPSQVTFKFTPIHEDMKKILKEIATNTGDVTLLPYMQRLMINIYPFYFNLQKSSFELLTFSLFTYPPPGPKDGDLAYQNMFDLMVDCFYSAMEKIGYSTVGLVVTETGWPWAGNGNLTTPILASTYNGILKIRVDKGLGTPMRPNYPIQTFIYALFDENRKGGDAYQQHWGMFNADDMTPIYPVF